MALYLRGLKCKELQPFFALTSASNQANQLYRDKFAPLNKVKLTGRRALLIEPVHKPNKPIRDIRWLSPSEIRRDDGRSVARWPLFVDALVPWDVRQNDLCDCWLLAALVALLAVRPDLIRQMVTGPETIGGVKVYKVRLYLDGRPIIVSVSESFPCDTDGQFMYGNARQYQLFVSLIEKAYALSVHSYETLNAGLSKEAFPVLTGYPSRKVAIRGSATDDVWSTLSEHHSSKYGLVASSGNSTLVEKDFTDVGLEATHAYAVLNLLTLCKTDGRQVRLIRLHSANDNDTWNGAYSDGSSEWCQAMLDQLHSINPELMPNKQSSGVFWMPIEKFVEYFQQVFVGMILDRKCFSDLRFDVKLPRWGDESRFHTVFQVTVPPLAKQSGKRKAKAQQDQQQHTSLFISAYQQCQRAKLCRHLPRLCFGMAIFEMIDLDEKITGNLLDFSGFSNALQQVCDFSQLAPGNYLVAMVNFDKWPAANDPPNVVEMTDDKGPNERLVVTFHSSRPIKVDRFNCQMSLQGNVLFELPKEYGKVVICAGGQGRVYTIADGESWMGFVVAVENRSKDISLECTLNYAPKVTNISTGNVRLTRGSPSTVDNIPPYSWQIVSVAMPFSTNMDYVIDPDWLQPQIVALTNAVPEEHYPPLGRNASIHSARKITYDLTD